MWHRLVGLLGHQNICRLEVGVAYACGVSRFDAYGDLLDEPHPLQAIEFSLRAMFIELSTIDEVEDKVRNTVFSGATSAGLFR